LVYDLETHYRGPWDITFHAEEDVTIHDNISDGFEDWSASAEFKVSVRFRIDDDGTLLEHGFTGKLTLSIRGDHRYYVARYPKPSGRREVVFSMNRCGDKMTFGRSLGLAVNMLLGEVVVYAERYAYRNMDKLPRNY
jgi:hypothetical protein